MSEIQDRTRVVGDLVAGLSSDSARVRFGAAKALRGLSERAPDLVYPHFDCLAGFLRHENSVLRWNAILVLGNLAPADTHGKLDRILDRYLAPIAGPHLIDAANTIRGAAAIAAAKPDLADKIARRIFEVEGAVYATPECRNVAVGHAINALDRLFPIVASKRAVRLFVVRQLDSPRPATRRKAEKFLRTRPLHHTA